MATAGFAPNYIYGSNVIYPTITDGLSSQSEYSDGGGLDTVGKWVQVDLGKVFTLRSVKFWSYYQTTRERSYKGQKIRLSNYSSSSPGVDVFSCQKYGDCGIATSSGLTANFADAPARFVRYYQEENNVNGARHFIELQAFECIKDDSMCPVGTFTQLDRDTPRCEARDCAKWGCSTGQYRSACSNSMPGKCSSSPSWVKITFSGTSPTFSTNHQYMVSFGSAFYVLGGSQSSGDTEARLDMTLTTPKWSSLGSANSDLRLNEWAHYAVVGEMLYALNDVSHLYTLDMSKPVEFGSIGTTDAGSTYATITSSWESKSYPNAPSDRWGSAFAASSSVLWLFGGRLDTADGYLDDLYSLDTSNSDPTWRFWTSSDVTGTWPSPRRYFDAAEIRGRIYFFGGKVGGVEFSNELWKLDTTTMPGPTWSLITFSGTMPDARYNPMLLAVGPTLYMFGGTLNDVNTRFSDFWKYDTYKTTAQWTRLVDLPAQSNTNGWNKPMRGVHRAIIYARERGSTNWWQLDACSTMTCPAGFYTAGCGLSPLTSARGCVPCKHTCPQGHYMVGSCDGGGTSDTVSCLPCRTSCSAGQHLSAHCAGTETQDVTCVDCVSNFCSPGNYLETACPGTGYSDVSSCASCSSTSCPADQYLSAQCFGSESSDVSSCSSCSTCAAGQYMQGKCSGSGTTDSVTCTACKTACQTGQYLSGTCSGSSTTDTVTCTACATSCGAGKYKSGGTCTGTSTTDTTQCTACTSTCAAGKYMSGSCLGTGTKDTVTCVDCKTTCPSGYYLRGTCDGTSTSDTTTCLPCTTSCASGSHLSGTCDGKGTSDSVTCTECTSTCPSCTSECSTMTLTGSCSGTGTYDSVQCVCGSKSCASGEYRLNCGNCTSCQTSCSAGLFLTGSCDGMGQTDTTLCVDCKVNCGADKYLVGTCSGTGTSDQVTCADCETTCSAGSYLSNRCSGTGTSDSSVCTACRTCPAGTYVSEPCDGTSTSDTSVCLPCKTSCGDGYFLSGTCSGTSLSDTITCDQCRDCDAGSYKTSACNGTTSYDMTTCGACSTCTSGQYKQGLCTGSSTTNTVSCAACKPCAAGQYLASSCSGEGTSDTVVCQSCKSQCPAGSYITGSCFGNSTRDVTLCVPCKSWCEPGVFLEGSCPAGSNTDTTQCRKCTQCAEGQYISRACSATQDTECSPCAKTVCDEGSYLSATCSGKDFVDVSSCTACKQCPTLQDSDTDHGYYKSGFCDGSSTEDLVTCVPCGTKACQLHFYKEVGYCDGTLNFDPVQCRPCTNTSCDPGYFLNDFCSGNGIQDQAHCKACRETCPADTYYVSGAFADCDGSGLSEAIKCNTCKDCGIDERKSRTCYGNETEDTVECASCQYTESNIRVCQDSGSEMYLQTRCPGTSTADMSVCAMCPANSFSYGMECRCKQDFYKSSLPSGAETCVACPTGTSSKQDSKTVDDCKSSSDLSTTTPGPSTIPRSPSKSYAYSIRVIIRMPGTVDTVTIEQQQQLIDAVRKSFNAAEVVLITMVDASPSGTARRMLLNNEVLITLDAYFDDQGAATAASEMTKEEIAIKLEESGVTGATVDTVGKLEQLIGTATAQLPTVEIDLGLVIAVIVVFAALIFGFGLWWWKVFRKKNNVSPEPGKLEGHRTYYMVDEELHIEFSASDPGVRLPNDAEFFMAEGTAVLPKGIKLDRSTGALDGPPEEKADKKTYKIVAKKGGSEGSIAATSQITFGVLPKIELNATTKTGVVYMVGENIEKPITIEAQCVGEDKNLPSSVKIEYQLDEGMVLPKGLSLNKQTGQLTGTPMEEKAMMMYRINAQTADGHTVSHCDVEFSVKSTAGATTISARVTKNMLKMGDQCTTEDMPDDLRKRYEPGRVIGKGGFGTVVEITHKSSRIQYALKMIASESESGFDEKTKKRLQREAGMLRAVDSPHVVGINEEGFTDDYRLFFMVMELLKGEPLDMRIDKRDYMTESEAAIAGMHVIRGLVEIHKKGVMHRDIKPGNIICTPDEKQQGGNKYTIIDLGIAVAVEGVEAKTAMKTTSNTFAGTLWYCSPEMITQHMNAPLGFHIDLWALGVTLFQLTTGKFPFDNITDINDQSKPAKDVLDEIAQDRRAGFSTHFSKILAKSMTKTRAERYEAAELMLEDLHQCLVARGESMYSVFISYRVFSESRMAHMLFKVLSNSQTANGHRVTVYLDHKRLEDGQPWEKGFCEGLLNSILFVPLVSNKGVTDIIAKLVGGDVDRPDNVLKELQLAVALMEVDDRRKAGGYTEEEDPEANGKLQGILPLLVNDQFSKGEEGYPCMKPFSFANLNFVDQVSNATTTAVVGFLKDNKVPVPEAAPNRTVKATMKTIMDTQGIQVASHNALEPVAVKSTQSFKVDTEKEEQIAMLMAELMNIRSRIHDRIDSVLSGQIVEPRGPHVSGTRTPDQPIHLPQQRTLGPSTSIGNAEELGTKIGNAGVSHLTPGPSLAPVPEQNVSAAELDDLIQKVDQDSGQNRSVEGGKQMLGRREESAGQLLSDID